MKKINYKSRYIYGIVFAILTLTSCENFVSVDISSDKLSLDGTYSSDASATSAVLALYSYPYSGSLYVSNLANGLSADELQFTSTSTDYLEFAKSSVTAINSTLNSSLWSNPYGIIREANLAIAGISSSKVISDSVKTRLLGETKFMRAFGYFNLVNSFGDVPLALSSSELENAYLSRSSTDAIWNQIINDLKDAESSLPTKYNTTLRVRVNKYTASALLARAYLYIKDYTNAEAEATKVISATDVTYALATLSATATSPFVNTSTEIIFQQGNNYGYAPLGLYYRSSSSTKIPSCVLYPGFVSAFETGDKRLTYWVDQATISGITYYKINKYKLYIATAGNEYNVLFRFAELYLIRAEARAQLATNLAGAISDLNVIRNRAGLANTTASTKVDLLTAIAKERKVEFFGENHRWYDLKRTNTVDAVIGALKPTTWKSTAVLYPIPYNQLLLNKNLTQNPGY